MNPFGYQKYYIRKTFWKIFGGELRIYDESKQTLLFYATKKALTIRDDITIFSDESRSRPILKVLNSSLGDSGWKIDIIDASTNQKLAILERRKFHKYTPNDPYILKNLDGVEVGNVYGSQPNADYGRMLLGSYIPNVIPREYAISLGTITVGRIKQVFNVIIPEFEIDFSMDEPNALDRKIGIAIFAFMALLKVKRT